MDISEAVEKILAGHLVVFPTETVYGIGALAIDEEAVKSLFERKGRPEHNPLILHIADTEQLPELVEEISEDAQMLIDAFWPGPLTICFKKSNAVPDLVTAGLKTVCIRQPNHPVAHEFLSAVGQAIAAPSANLSGKPSTTNLSDAERQLEAAGVFFLDGGQTPLGLESTVVDCSSDEVKLLRPGSVSVQDIEKVLEKKVVDHSSGKKVTSPGQTLEHYAPQGELRVVFGAREDRKRWFAEQQFDLDKTWALGLVGTLPYELSVETTILCEGEEALDEYAKNLYAFLNHCDELGAEHILLELPKGDHPLLPTLLNRLEKASDGKIITV